MKKTKFTSFFILLVIATVNGWSQEAHSGIPWGNYLVLGSGYSKMSVDETINTTVPYSGSGMGAELEVLFGSEKHHCHIRNYFSFGNLSPYKSTSPDKNTANTYMGNFGVAYYWRVYQYNPQSFRVYTGPIVNAEFGIRFKNGELGNSAMSYEGALSAGLALKADKYFNISANKNNSFKRFKAGVSLSVPVLSKIYTPNYLGISETAATDDVAIIDWSSNYTGYFNSIETGIALTYYLKNKNAIELAYSRDFFTTSPKYNPVKTMNQSFIFKFLFNLK